MARLTKDITIEAPGRDHGKTFRLTEMSAAAAEKWAMRAVLALGHAGYQVPDNFLGGGIAVLASIGFSALLRVDFYEAEPLLDDMMQCVSFVADPTRDVVRKLMEDDTEEVTTRVTLREGVAALHLGFSPAEKFQNWVSALKAQAESKDTPTSAT